MGLFARSNTGYRLLKSMYRDQITHPSHLAPCRSTICHPPPKVSHKTLHVREMVRAETNAADNLRKAKSDLYSLEADLLAIQRDLERQMRRKKYRGCHTDTDICMKYKYYNLTDFTPSLNQNISRIEKTMQTRELR